MIDPTNHDHDDEPKSRSWVERLSALISGEPQDRDQLMEVLRDASERHIMSGEMLGMIERILQVSEMQVREVMVPKKQMVSILKNKKLKDILPVVIDSGHSRFPVFDARGREIVGILLAKDLIRFCIEDKEEVFSLDNIIRPAFFTSQSKRLDILLREFRAKRNHLAIVLDEYGNVAGLVTIEDVLEQIVGEIEDEYDVDEENGHIKKLDANTYIVKASTQISEFNHYFNTKFSDEEFDTIGGILLKHFSHLPKRGEKMKLQNLRFKILHSDNRRIYLLEVKPIKSKKT